MERICELGHVYIYGKWIIEWGIYNFFSYTKIQQEDLSFISPSFSIQGFDWHFQIYPKGETRNGKRWISLYLCRNNSGDDSEIIPSSKGAIYSFGVKKADGCVEKRGEVNVWLFGEPNLSYGNEDFLERSELMRRRSDLAPSDVLTVTCDLWVMDNFGPSLIPNTLSKNLADLFTSKKGSDATLKVQNEEFPVHKCILAARSTVFEAMFEVEMKEKETGVVHIEDCDPEVFKHFLVFVYSGNVHIRGNEIFELYKIAEKYDVQELKHVCILRMMRFLSMDNVCETAVLADKFREKPLSKRIQKFFNDNFTKIISTANWDTFMMANTPLVSKLLKGMTSDKKV